MRQKFGGYLWISQLMKVSDRNILQISMVITMLKNAKHSGQTTCMHHIRQSSIATVCSVQRLLWNNVFGLGEVIQSWCIKSFCIFFFLMRSQGDSSDARVKVKSNKFCGSKIQWVFMDISAYESSRQKYLLN